MTFNPVAWSVDGARVPASLARIGMFASTGGAEGIVLPTDLKVTANTTANNQVNIAPGAGLVRNRYAGSGNRQTYVVENPEQTPITVPATGSAAGATSYVIVRLRDPQYPGTPIPADPLVGPYVFPELVTSITNLTYPFIVLAKIVQPINTAAITSTMITDMRKMALPRRIGDKIMTFPTSDNNMPTAGYSNWPGAAARGIECPDWATTLKIVAHLSGVEIIGGAGVRVFGGVRTYYGPNFNEEKYASQNGIIAAEGSANPQRSSTTVVGIHDVYSLGQQGAVWQMLTQGYRTSPSGTIQADYQTAIVLDYEFVEEIR